MALNTFGARTFRARTFKSITGFSVYVVVKKKKTGGGGGHNEDYEVFDLRERILRDDEEVLAIIVAAVQAIGG